MTDKEFEEVFSKQKEERLCITCKHFHRSSLSCHRNSIVDKVNGGSYPDPLSTYAERRQIGISRIFLGACGEVGKYWEAKEER